MQPKVAYRDRNCHWKSTYDKFSLKLQWCAIFYRSRYVTLCVTLSVTQATSDLEVTSRAKTQFGESTLHSELRRFREFQIPHHPRGSNSSQGCTNSKPKPIETKLNSNSETQNSSGCRVQLQNFGSVRPAGRTRFASFHSEGQPSVVIGQTGETYKLITTVKRSPIEVNFHDNCGNNTCER